MTDEKKVALVTGCSSGIGEATAWALATDGYEVLATARNLSDLEPLRKRAIAAGLSMRTRSLDVTRQDAIDGIISDIEDRYGRLDVLVNNAGYALLGAVEEVPMEDLRKQFETNVFGLVAVYKAAIPLMRKAGGGTVVNVSSVAGRVAAPLMGAYCASKFAVEALGLAAAAEVRQFGIRVVSVEPGPVRTRFIETARKASGHIINRQDSLYSKSYIELNDFYGEPYGVPPEAVARVIMKVVRAKRPKTRYTVRARERLYTMAGALIATRVGQHLVRGYFGLKLEKTR